MLFRCFAGTTEGVGIISDTPEDRQKAYDTPGGWNSAVEEEDAKYDRQAWDVREKCGVDQGNSDYMCMRQVGCLRKRLSVFQKRQWEGGYCLLNFTQGCLFLNLEHYCLEALWRDRIVTAQCIHWWVKERKVEAPVTSGSTMMTLMYLCLELYIASFFVDDVITFSVIVSTILHLLMNKFKLSLMRKFVGLNMCIHHQSVVYKIV